MPRKTPTPTASEQDLAEVISLATNDGPAGLARLDGLLKAHDADARLHFLRGSLLAAAQAYPAARAALQAALQRAPSFALARFQLGLLELSSGEPAAAVETLRPLGTLPPDSPISLFARGLNHLIVDDFGAAIALLEDGIARNSEHPAMNHDMQLLIDGMRGVTGVQAAESQPVSAAHFLLQQYGQRPPST